MKRRKVYQPQKINTPAMCERAMEKIRRQKFRVGTIIKDSKGVSYEVQADGSWKRVEGKTIEK